MTIQKIYSWFGFICFWSLLLLGTYEVITYIIQANAFIDASLAI